MNRAGGQAGPPPLDVRALGVMDYREALDLQHRLVDARVVGDIPDTLLLVEHPPVFTLGRRRSAADNVLLPGDVPVVQVARGGDVTWHGPGQLVGYPILALGAAERDLHAVLRRLEDALIAVLAACGVEGGRREGYTGVWADGVKLVSLGIAVRGWVTFHGFALNVDPDLSWFGRINPCGLDSGVMGSIDSVGGVAPPPDDLRGIVAREVAGAFGRRVLTPALDMGDGEGGGGP